MINNININELSEGGRGLQLIWLLTDELNYIHTPEHQNCLILVKNYQKNGLYQSHKINKVSNFKQFTELLNPFKFNNSQENLLNNICDIPIQKICLKVNTDLNNLVQILPWYEQLDHLPIPQLILDQCKLALVEGFTNAVRHAHKGMPVETPIELEVTVFNGRLEMKIWDYGQPFDLKEKLREKLTSNSSFSTKMT